MVPVFYALPHANLSAAHYRYSPNELRYLPVSTALYEPPLDPELPALDSEPDSDDAEDGNEDKKNKNSSVRRQTHREEALIDVFSLLSQLTHAWLPTQDSSSGNTSDVEAQEGGGGQGQRSKGKDKLSTPGKDGSHRHSATHKSTPGYKVEDKTTWTLLQQQQQQHFFYPLPSSFFYYRSLTTSILPPLP